MTRMADENPGRELPQRVRGATRSAPPARAPSSSVLSEDLRQRMRAAVTAERSGAATKQDEAPGGEETGPEPVPPAGPEITARSETTAVSKPPAVSGPPASPARAANAGPMAEDEITQWLGTTAQPPSSVRPGAAGRPQAGSPRPAGGSRARLAAMLVVVVLFAGVLAAAAIRYSDRSPGASPTSPAAARQAAAARVAAATWVAQQVSRDVVVSCDPAMCAALKAHGFPAGKLLAVGSGSEVPVSSAVVVETPAVLSLFGSSLATAWAPAVLASFGSGPYLVTVRVIDRNGSAAYRTKLNADLADRKAAGAGLLGDAQISVTQLASGQLTTGMVDSRLVLVLAAVAGHQPISIVQFGNPGPGPSGDVPLRFVDLSEHDRAGHLSSAAYVRTLRAYLSAVDVSFRPARMTVVPADGQDVLRVEVTAPSPLGVIGPQSSP
jgi:hypothetical protein